MDEIVIMMCSVSVVWSLFEEMVIAWFSTAQNLSAIQDLIWYSINILAAARVAR